MKKKTSSYFSEVSGVRLFRDDIDEILQRFQKKSLFITIHNSSFVYENIEEVINFNGYNPNELILQGGFKKDGEIITVAIEKGDVRIEAEGSEGMYTFGFEMKDFF